MSASTVTSVVTYIRNTLQQNANKADSQMIQKYFKNVLEFHGIRAPKLNALFKELYSSQISELDTDDQLKVAYSLFDSKLGEEKSIGCRILTKNTKKLGVQHLPRLEELIDNHIYDWGTADKFSGQVMHFLITKDKKVPSLIAKWKDAENVWRKRVSCVSFVKLARHGKYNDIIYDICETTVKCNERFVQLGAGWVLRELSLADLGAVVSAVAAIKGFLPVVKEVLNIIQKGVQTAQQVLNTVDEKLKGLPLADNQKKALRELAACAPSKLIDGTNIPKSTLQEVGKRFGEAFEVDVTNFADQFTNALNEVTTIDPRIHTN